MKSELAIKRELCKIERRKSTAKTETDGYLAYGAEQALAWVLGGYAPVSKLIETTDSPEDVRDIRVIDPKKNSRLVSQ